MGITDVDFEVKPTTQKVTFQAIKNSHHFWPSTYKVVANPWPKSSGGWFP